jgi:hypothetical protein
MFRQQAQLAGLPDNTSDRKTEKVERNSRGLTDETLMQ